MSSSEELGTLAKLYEENQEQIHKDYFEFLKFKSISSEPKFKDDVRACAKWVEGYLIDAGLCVSQWETSGFPVVFAEHHVDDSKPTVLLYGHYDVQPVDPLELWESPPFEPTVKDGQVFARGAQDNKGQCFYFSSAIKALLARDGTLPINLKILIEGGEEIGSPGLGDILLQKKDQLKADYVFVVDLGYHQPNRPAISLGLRGIVTMTLEVTGSNTDLHSGAHGGLVYNPNRAIAELLESLVDENGKVTVPGFYDNLEPISEEAKAQLDFEFNHELYEGMFAAKATGGEKDLPPLESLWLRPTLEINGIGGGYFGNGFKTVIPAKAIAKISCRLVPGQNPMKIGKAVKDFLEQKAPDGLRVSVDIHPGVGEGIRTSPNSAGAKAAFEAFEEVTGFPCHYILEGASIPIAVELAQVCEAEPVFLGHALPTDNIHAPNEHFGLDRFRLGFLSICRIIQKLG